MDAVIMEEESYMKCPFCGGELAFDAEFKANSLFGGEYSDDAVEGLTRFVTLYRRSATVNTVIIGTVNKQQ